MHWHVKLWQDMRNEDTKSILRTCCTTRDQSPCIIPHYIVHSKALLSTVRRLWWWWRRRHWRRSHTRRRVLWWRQGRQQRWRKWAHRTSRPSFATSRPSFATRFATRFATPFGMAFSSMPCSSAIPVLPSRWALGNQLQMGRLWWRVDPHLHHGILLLLLLLILHLYQ